MAGRKRVLIIGLDGFTWDLGRPFMAEGIMPNLRRLLEQGCHGALGSVMPYETAPAWAAFQTGCRPGKTHIFSFHSFDRSNRAVRLNRFSDIAVPSLWELASRAGKRVASLNMPITFPAPPVNGVIVPGLLCPGISRQNVYPIQAYDKYILPQTGYKIVDTDHSGTVRAFIDRSIKVERTRCHVAKQIMKNEDWDLFSVVMQSFDPVQHRLWNVLAGDGTDASPEERIHALEFYRRCDQYIGELIETAGEGVATIVASDHGFQRLGGVVNLNVWLREHGYLHLVSHPQRQRWETMKKRIPPLRFLARLYGAVRRQGNVRRQTGLVAETVVGHLHQLIDFERTQAICLGGFAGLLFLTGKGSQRQALAETLRKELERDFGEHSSHPLIVDIRSGKDAYGISGDPDWLADLVVSYAPGISSRLYPVGQESFSTNFFPTGTHSSSGIFLISGPGVCQGRSFPGEIVDITPTILAYLGVSVPHHMDGAVLQRAFETPLAVTLDDRCGVINHNTEYGDEEQAMVEKQLSDLGYL
ncbi:MAG: alkaline phosphatase family protein [Sedimentisphaerales bacterium]|nr:alkaline phosphatase family protein [Sedimentisphaerales bacterium]